MKQEQERTKCERVRDIKGRFIFINGKEKYKNIQYKGKKMGEHRKVWIKMYGEIPKGKIIHHVNGNKKDNRIENLECISYKKHNRIHSHPAWNKGLKCPNISKSKIGHKVTYKQIQKLKLTYFLEYLDTNIEIWKMRDKGYSWGYIIKKLNLPKGKVIARWRGFKKYYLASLEEV